MEISLREWLIIGGILVIVLILIDGWRRIRGNRNQIRMDIDHSVSGDTVDTEPQQANPELPNGGVRRLAGDDHPRYEPSFGEPVAPASTSRREPSLESALESAQDSDAPLTVRSSEPEPESARDGAGFDGAPDVVEPGQRAVAEEWVPEREPERSADTPREQQNELWEMDPLFDDIPVDQTPRQRRAPAPRQSPSGARDSLASSGLRAERDEAVDEPATLGLDFDLEQPIPVLMDRVRNNQQGNARKNGKVKAQDANPNAELALKPLVAESSAVSESAEPDAKSPQIDEAEHGARGRPDISVDPDEMLVIFVVAGAQPLPGTGVKRIAEACGMEFGEMQIFHRYEEPGAQGALQFSMANAVNPGTFDVATLEQSETPAVSFFMSMRDPSDPLNAYECMLATAETLARHLGAELLDGDRSVMRPQTKEHYRERIRDFEIHQRYKRTH